MSPETAKKLTALGARLLVQRGAGLPAHFTDAAYAGAACALCDTPMVYFAIHHLDDDAKADLYQRIASSLRIGGRFVICDVVLPESPVDEAIPLEDGIDQPALLRDQLEWLRSAGLVPTVMCERGDRAVVAADRSAEPAGAAGSARYG